jgi:hypothetical protein
MFNIIFTIEAGGSDAFITILPQTPAKLGSSHCWRPAQQNRREPRGVAGAKPSTDDFEQAAQKCPRVQQWVVLVPWRVR